MPRDGLFTLGILCTHIPGRAVLAQIAAAFVFPIAFAVGGGIVQGLIFGTNHIVVIFIVNIFIPRVVAVFCFGAGIGSGKDTAALEDSFADPRGLVGTVSAATILCSG